MRKPPKLLHCRLERFKLYEFSCNLSKRWNVVIFSLHKTNTFLLTELVSVVFSQFKDSIVINNIGIFVKSMLITIGTYTNISPRVKLLSRYFNLNYYDTETILIFDTSYSPINCLPLSFLMIFTPLGFCCASKTSCSACANWKTASYKYTASNGT